MKVLISLPNTGWIHKHVFSAAVGLLQDPRHEVKLIRPTHNPYENNLHHIVNEFVARESDFWINIDADNPPMENVLDLVYLDLDVVGCPTPVWHFTDKVKGERPVYYNAYDYVGEEGYKEHLPHEGLQEVDAVGTGCFVVAARVFQDPEMRKAPFQRQWKEDGTVHKGNDISFCERAKTQGFRIFCDYDYPCMHFNELELNEVVRAFQGVYE
jgi:hypothetical protein